MKFVDKNKMVDVESKCKSVLLQPPPGFTHPGYQGYVLSAEKNAWFKDMNYYWNRFVGIYYAFQDNLDDFVKLRVWIDQYFFKLYSSSSEWLYKCITVLWLAAIFLL